MSPQATNTAAISFRRAPGEKRSALLEAARTLFSEQGFAGTSTAQIAREAGVSEGILFHHFGSKKGLFEAIAEAFVEAGIAATTAGRLHELSEETIVRSAFDFADTDPGLYQLLSHFSSETDATARSDRFVAAIQHRLEEAIARGLARDGDTAIMARLQFVLVDGAYKAWRRDGRAARREDYIREAAIALRATSARSCTEHQEGETQP
jgi:AcrR family transcriptional regulator